MKKNSTRIWLASILILPLAACGGGGADSGRASPGVQSAMVPQAPIQTPHAIAAVNYNTAVQQLYIAYFGRPADPGGLTNFSAALAAAGASTDIQGLNTAYGSNATVKSLVDAFGSSAESNALYTGTTTDFVNAIYNHVLNRNSDSAGLQFWVNAINQGVLTRGNAALSIMAGALVNTSSQGLIDAAVVNNKVLVGANFTFTIASTGAQGYAGDPAAAIARAMLSSVSNTTNVTAFQTTINSTLSTLAANAGNTWLTFTPDPINLVAFPGLAKPFGVTAVSSRTITQQINIAIIDSQGVLSTGTSISGSGLTYTVVMNTSPSLTSGFHQGTFQVRLCYDSNPQVCSNPVSGSPWAVPYSIQVLDQSALHYSTWEDASHPDFTDNFALSSAGSTLVTVAAGFYSAVMETWTSSDDGVTWTQSQATGPTPLTKGFALATDGAAVYLSGGEKLAAYGASLGTYANHVWKFNGSVWTQKTSAAAFPARTGHIMTKVGDTLYVMGGRNASGTLRDIWKSSDDGVNWTKVSDALPAAVGTVTCASNWQNSLLIVGDALMTSTDGATWTSRASSSDLKGLTLTTTANNGNISMSKSPHCAVMNGRLYLRSNSATSSSDDLLNWQPEMPPLSGVAAFDAPGMVAVDGHLVYLTGLGTSQRQVMRTKP